MFSRCRFRVFAASIMGLSRECVAHQYHLRKNFLASLRVAQFQKFRRFSLMLQARPTFRSFFFNSSNSARRHSGIFSSLASHSHLVFLSQSRPRSVSSLFSVLRTLSTALVTYCTT